MSDSAVSKKFQILIFSSIDLFIFWINSIQDPAIALREQCGNDQECRKYKAALEECTKRVNSTPGTHENCEEELFDFLKCVDHCVNILFCITFGFDYSLG